MKRIPALDGLRGYAALLVLVSHLPTLLQNQPGGNPFQGIYRFCLGYLGVDIFFVLSGFLITRILLNEKKNGRLSLSIFYKKRILRIFPIYYLTVFLCSFLSPIEGLPYLLTYTANFYFATHGSIPHPLTNAWSLSVEEHYYLLWPLAMVFFDSSYLQKKIVPVILGIVVLSLVIAFYSIQNNLPLMNYTIYYGSSFRVLSIGFGSLLAFYEKDIYSFGKEHGSFRLFIAGLVCYLAAITAFYISFSHNISYLLGSCLFLFSFCSFFLFLAVIVQQQRSGGFNQVFTNKGIKYLGKISYGLYLYHYPIFFYSNLKFLENPNAYNSVLYVIGIVIATFAISIISYEFLEKPLLDLKSKIEPDDVLKY